MSRKNDKEWLKWIRSLPCIFESEACEGDVQAHHRTGAGLAVKAPDNESMPLCVAHHAQRHDGTGVFFKLTKSERKAWEAEMVAKYQALHASQHGGEF